MDLRVAAMTPTCWRASFAFKSSGLTSLRISVGGRGDEAAMPHVSAPFDDARRQWQNCLFAGGIYQAVKVSKAMPGLCRNPLRTSKQ